MRTRLIRPEFYADETLASAKLPTRYVYIGLWTLCDDAGWFERKPRQIAAALFPYDSPTTRQHRVDLALEELVELRRVEWLPCGLHGKVPTLPRHGQKGGNKSETMYSRHKSTCLFGQVPPSTDKSSSESVLGSVSESVSESAQARETMDAPGLKATLGEYHEIVGRSH